MVVGECETVVRDRETALSDGRERPLFRAEGSRLPEGGFGAPDALDDAFEQALGEEGGAVGVERADEGDDEDAAPDLDDGADQLGRIAGPNGLARSRSLSPRARIDLMPHPRSWSNSRTGA
jgi:hypothetical protein